MERPTSRRVMKFGLAAACLAALAGSTWGLQPKEAGSSLDEREFFKPELYISTSHLTLEEALEGLPNKAAWDARLQRNAEAGQHWTVFVDGRSGAVTNILAAIPVLPGSGVGNKVTREALGAALGRAVPVVDAAVVSDVILRFALAHRDVLGIDTAQLGAARTTQVHEGLWQVSIPQQLAGIPVRGGRLAASISHGNLVTIGTEGWADVRIDVTPLVKPGQVLELGFAHLGGRSALDEVVQEPTLEIVPVAPPQYQRGDAFDGPLGKGLGHRLVYVFAFQRAPELARYEVLVDARSGEVLAMQDTNQYIQKQVTGGIYPLTSTDQCPDAQRCGTMQTGYPMPFANTGLASPNNFTNSAGVLNYTSGTVTTSLAGKYVRISDNCGSISSSSATGDINLGGTNGQHDCTTPGSGGAGNTAASRSAFYEINKINELARGWLPTNTWLQGQLVSNVNINLTCNGFWSPTAQNVNFYRSGGGCRNTGEIAAVFDHEWGHGMDDNDANGTISTSGEAYADIASIYRLQSSCVGYGFFWTTNKGCGQTADGTGFNQNEALQGASHCNLDCSGVRDVDWDKHADHTPDTALGFVCTSCTSGTGTCGKQTHCSAAPVRQAAWDFVTRDLAGAPFNLDTQSAFIAGNRLFYHGTGNVGTWHSCTCGSSASGCGTTNGYMQWITADDDNGNLSDGTPHMTAIFNAYNRHGIACATPTAQNSGCSGGPTAAPTLTATPGNYQVGLSWTTVSGATRYWVFRGEGHGACNMGKALIATVTGTTYTDTQVANGRTYYYTVVAAGASNSCYGRAATCTSATPTATASPDFSIACSPSSLSVQQGNSGASTCTVTSTGGFASAVALDCTGLPSGVTCGYSPSSVTPPANGTVNSALTVSVGGSVAAGSYSFSARGTNGATSRTASISLTVTATPTPNFSVSCSPSSLSAAAGGNATSTCTVASTNGFNSAVSLACTGLPAGATCGFSPASVTPPANGSVTSALTVSVGGSVAAGSYPFQAQGTSGALVRTGSLTLTVTGTDIAAAYDATLRAPRCSTVGRSCDSGAALLLGRATKGPEPNQPNTINSTCADGTSGTFHSDESNDRLKVSTVDGTALAPGKSVRIDATVWAWTTPSADKLDLYYAANANSPTWTFLTTLTPTAAGAATLSATYTLPTGTLQAVRAQFRYQGSASSCTSGGYNDRDDLIFAVNP